MSEVVEVLRTCGNYDTQAAVVELLLRVVPKRSREEVARGWFPDTELLRLFTSIRQFESDCRTFLNQLNLHQTSGQLVVSLAAASCRLAGRPLLQPPAADYSALWVDFNLGRPAGVSLYCVREGEEAWELVTLPEEAVVRVELVPAAAPEHLLLTVTQGSGEVAELVLGAELRRRLETVLGRMFGGRYTPPATEPVPPARRLPPLVSQELPAVTSVPASDEVSSSQESLPCGQPPRERQVQGGRRWVGRREALKEARTYSPVVVIGAPSTMGKVATEQPTAVGENATEKKGEEKDESDEDEVISETPEMTGGPAGRDDVAMTMSGGRRRATRRRTVERRVSEPMRRNLEVEMVVQEGGGRKRCRSSPAEQRSLGLFSDESGGEELAVPGPASPRQAKGSGGLKGWLGKMPRLLSQTPGKRSRRASVSPSLDTVAEVSAGGARKRRFASMFLPRGVAARAGAKTGKEKGGDGRSQPSPGGGAEAGRGGGEESPSLLAGARRTYCRAGAKLLAKRPRRDSEDRLPAKEKHREKEEGTKEKNSEIKEKENKTKENAKKAKEKEDRAKEKDKRAKEKDKRAKEKEDRANEKGNRTKEKVSRAKKAEDKTQDKENGAEEKDNKTKEKKDVQEQLEDASQDEEFQGQNLNKGEKEKVNKTGENEDGSKLSENKDYSKSEEKGDKEDESEDEGENCEDRNMEEVSWEAPPATKEHLGGAKGGGGDCAALRPTGLRVVEVTVPLVEWVARLATHLGEEERRRLGGAWARLRAAALAAME